MPTQFFAGRPQSLGQEGVLQLVTLRSNDQFNTTVYAIPEGCVGAYYPEASPLAPLSHHDKKAHTPAYKATPVRVPIGEARS